MANDTQRSCAESSVLDKPFVQIGHALGLLKPVEHGHVDDHAGAVFHRPSAEALGGFSEHGGPLVGDSEGEGSVFAHGLMVAHCRNKVLTFSDMSLQCGYNPPTRSHTMQITEGNRIQATDNYSTARPVGTVVRVLSHDDGTPMFHVCWDTYRVGPMSREDYVSAEEITAA